MTEGDALAVLQYAQQSGVDETRMTELREQFRGIHLTLCDDDDVIEGKPFLRSPRWNIYLVDGREHCMALTHDLESATGLLIAEVTNESD